METTEKTRENRLRRTLGRRGYALARSRRRDPRAADFGAYTITDAEGVVVYGAAARRSLDDVEAWAGKECASDSEGAWEQVGEVCVDSGRLLLADPCYDLPEDFLASVTGDGYEACPGERLAHGSLAMMVHTGYGDGFYPVSVMRTPDGLVAAVRVDFIAAG